MSSESAAAARPVRQEQQEASDEITEVAPGVLRLQLPIALPGLGHVNCYAIEDERGVAVVDPGLPGPTAWADLGSRLAAAGFALRHVHTVVVTHSHFDHFGAAQHLRDETGADIVTHEYFRTGWEEQEAGEFDDSELLELGEDDAIERMKERLSGQTTPWGTRRSSPPEEALRQFFRWGRPGRFFPTPEPSVRIADKQVLRLGRREWLAVHTPGHTEDHLCLFDPEHGVMLSGDHVLPTITPHISGYSRQRDPLAAFFASLYEMQNFDTVAVVLPAHGHPFDDLAARAEHIIEHHQERLEIIRRAAAEIGEATVSQYMKVLFKERSWGEMAESETFAHLRHLEVLGEVVAGSLDGVTTYQPA